MNPVKINVTLSRTFDNKPLVELHDPLCGNDSAHTPQQLRDIATALLKIADDAAEQPMGRRTYRQVTRSYTVGA